MRAPLRDSRGRWLAGRSPNPGGRPAGVHRLAELAREHSEEALQALVDIMRDESAPPASRIAACVAILDRGWGRPPQAVQYADPDPVRSWRGEWVRPEPEP